MATVEANVPVASEVGVVATREVLGVGYAPVGNPGLELDTVVLRLAGRGRSLRSLGRLLWPVRGRRRRRLVRGRLVGQLRAHVGVLALRVD